jgi:chaperonin GroEL (HSP60 family)
MSISYAPQGCINGLGLLGQPIHKIQEDDISLDKIEKIEKSYNEYTDGRKADTDEFSQKFDKEETAKPTENPTHLLFLSFYNTMAHEHNPVLEQRILTTEKAIHYLQNEYNEAIQSFHQNLIQLDRQVKNEEDFDELLAHMIKQWTTITTLQEYNDRSHTVFNSVVEKKIDLCSGSNPEI